MVTITKYSIIILCSEYTIRKIMNSRNSLSLTRLFFELLFLFGNSLFVCLLRRYLPSASLLLMVSVSVCVHIFFLRITPSISIVATIISYGITYLEYLGGVLFLILLKNIFPHISATPEIVQTVIIGLTQISLALLLFKVKRFSHGLPFLADSKYGDLGVYLSTAVLMAASFLGMKVPKHYITATIAYSLFALGMILWFWFKHRVTQEYCNQIQKREWMKMQEHMTALKKENEVLSSIVHKDNKLIPALDLSVKEFLAVTAQNDCREERMKSTQAIISQIEQVSSERAGTIRSYEQESTPNIKTSSPVIDALFSLMTYKAKFANAKIVFSALNDIDEALNNCISVQDASTLLADLIENAIIAVKHSQQEKLIYVEIGKDEMHETLYIQVSDSGVPFPQEVLDRLGTQRITTHKDSGGSGIGMMTICEICRKYEASFFIISYPNNSPYTKSVKICFDHGKRFCV